MGEGDELVRLGIFGGTFDPPHLGHLILADEALDQLNLDRVLWLLTPNPPHKTRQLISPLETRLKLLEFSLESEPRFEILRLDIDRPAPHYAADSMRLLRQAYPKANLVYLMGGDSLNDLPTWMRPQQFVEGCDEIGVMPRPGRSTDLVKLENQIPGIKGKVRFIKAPLLEISSSNLREKITAGNAYRYYLVPAVYEFIEQQQLYRLDIS